MDDDLSTLAKSWLGLIGVLLLPPAFLLSMTVWVLLKVYLLTHRRSL